LHPNDTVNKINGISIAGMVHQDIIGVITSTTKLRVLVARPDGRQGTFKRMGSISTVAPGTKVAVRTTEPLASSGRVDIAVTIVRPNMQSSFGFGFGETAGGDFIVSSLNATGLAVGKLMQGDYLHTINGELATVKTLTHDQAVSMITRGLELRLGVLRDTHVDHIKTALRT
jgi:hypothetical protein